MRLLTTTAVFASSLGLISAAYPSYPEVQDLYARDLYDTPDIYARDAYDDYGASELYARDDFDDNELLARDADYDDGSFPESDGLFTRASEGGMSGGSCMDCRMAFVSHLSLSFDRRLTQSRSVNRSASRPPRPRLPRSAGCTV